MSARCPSRAWRAGAALWLSLWSSVWVLLSVSGQARAAEWLVVHDGRSERVAIDLARIEAGIGGVTAWSRIELDREVRDAAGKYDNIRVNNAYDCARRTFTILRRAYFNGDTLLREDRIAERQRNAIEVGSLDERVFSVACRQTAISPAMAGQGAAEVHVLPVADQATDRPRLLNLPLIDKAAADRAAAEVAGKKAVPSAAATPPAVAIPGGTGKSAVPSARPEGSTPGAPAATKPAENSSAAGKPSAADKKPSTSAVAGGKTPAKDAAAERRLRELYYATSGPRRAPATRPHAADAATKSVSRALPDDWAYTGEKGPAHWAKLHRDYALCGAGKRQSPIDIRDGVKVDLEPIRFDYKATRFRITDTGHTLRVSPREDVGLTLTGKRYRLVEFHFHQPAEEQVEGHAHDMALHMTHRGEDGAQVVVTVFLTRGETEQPALQMLWNNLPLDRGLTVAPEEALDLNALLPEDRRYWTYIGSLTEPPCSEGVTWLVFKQPVVVSAAQVAIFSRLYPHNARPVQPGNGRLIKESR